MESDDIWIDSEQNGFVSAWMQRSDPAVIKEIRNHQTWSEFSAVLFENFEGVIAQGDRFFLHQHNRVYVTYDGGPTTVIPDGLRLFAFDAHENHDWELLASTDLCSRTDLAPVYIGLPPDTFRNRHLSHIPTQWPSTGEYRDNVWMANLKIELAASPNEKHTNNNVSTERILLVEWIQH